MYVFACSRFHKFANIYSEMKKILFFVLSIVVCLADAGAVSRGDNANTRAKSNVSTTTKKARSITSRNAIKTTVTPRSAKSVSVLTPRQKTNTATRTPTSTRVATKNISARAAATTDTKNVETRTGAEYEQCKTAFFTCMDQFCQLKDDSYRRCSCNDRVFDFEEISKTYKDASDKLTEFSENLDVVGMTKEQATAMKTASEGENAMIEDKSASKQLLQAIMNSIKGESSSVGGKYKDLNSVTISADLSNAFGTNDSGQIIASYNGSTLYKAVYPKCRNAVKEDCNNASLQRAVNAYLMAIEQDCNTVETALAKQQKTLKASTHQSSAMLDLARVENRQKHNSDDTATCLTNVEASILSEEVCGAKYHKCLDYGQYIDVTTGAPLTGVKDFAELAKLLTFRDDSEIKDQKLSTLKANQTFVQFFENKTKKFAKDALDKCTEDSDFVWQQYLDQALLDIYYAQRDKVNTIKQSCLDLVAKCYDNQNVSIKNAMANLTGDSSILLKPTTLSLTSEMCKDYIDSCNAMFSDNEGKSTIIQEYIKTKNSSDSLSACRAVAQKCFDDFGGTGYNNFYYPQSGLFKSGAALDWFTLYKYTIDQENNPTIVTNTAGENEIISPCAQQVFDTPGCEDILEDVFGGFNKVNKVISSNNENVISTTYTADTNIKENRSIRPTGVATEVYYKILDNLKTDCKGLNGYFVEYKYAEQYGYKPGDSCYINSSDPASVFYINSQGASPRSLVYWYHFVINEYMCPANYSYNVDTQSWGMCSCWENGGRRSKNGLIASCKPLLPAVQGQDGDLCTNELLCKKEYDDDEEIPLLCRDSRALQSVNIWCQQEQMSSLNQVCPMTYIYQEAPADASLPILCADSENATQGISAVSAKVPHH